MPFSHCSPLAVQAVGLHVHDDVPPTLTHVWFEPHVSDVTHCVQPVVPLRTQLCTVPLTHCVAPSVQAFVQHAAEPAVP